MSRKFSLIPGILICFAVSGLHADEASRTAKAEEYLRVSRTEEMLNKTMAMVLSQAKSGMVQKMMGVTPTEAQTEQMNQLQDKLGAILASVLSWDKLKPVYVKLYADAYTDDELDGIIAFYKSPAGQAMITKTPGIMTKSNDIVQRQMAVAMPEIQKLIQDSAPPKK